MTSGAEKKVKITNGTVVLEVPWIKYNSQIGRGLTFGSFSMSVNLNLVPNILVTVVVPSWLSSACSRGLVSWWDCVCTLSGHARSLRLRLSLKSVLGPLHTFSSLRGGRGRWDRGLRFLKQLLERWQVRQRNASGLSALLAAGERGVLVWV